MKRKRIDLTQPVASARMPLGVAVRVFAIGSIAIVASAYAIYRHHWVPRPSLLRAVPDAASVSPPDQPDLLPAPELLPIEPPAGH